MAQWKLLRIGGDYQNLSEQYGLDPVVMRILKNRQIDTPERIEQFLHGTIKQCYSPMLLPDMEKACELIMEAIHKSQNIRIIGDYDVDGICATAILLKGLSFLGANADARIPDRRKDGYGLNEQLILDAADEQKSMIITCDNGIAAHNAIALAKQKNMTVIVTDHHEIIKHKTKEDAAEKVTEDLPDADAIVNPKRRDSSYPYAEICGAYVAYKLISALCKGKMDVTMQSELIQLAGMATVADVMPLSDENRILVKEALRTLPFTTNMGLRSLMMQNQLKDRKITAYHIGFVLGPCMNASGRLDTALRALDLLMEKDEKKASILAAQLKELNERRKELTLSGFEQAVSMISSKEYEKDKVLVLYLKKSHESIAGIIAGRLKEKYYKPVFVFTDANEGLKGSGRSIEAYDMYENISKCSDLFDKFGGHKMAAGISLPKENLDAFRVKINEYCNLTMEELTPVVKIDVDLPFGYVTQKLIEDLSVLEPFGMSNPKPVFAVPNVHFKRGRIIGKNSNAAIFYVSEEGMGKKEQEIKYFGDIDAFNEYIDQKFGVGRAQELYCGREVVLNICYYPQMNEYRGEKTIQFILQDFC